jgi:hypothetical protein
MCWLMSSLATPPAQLCTRLINRRMLSAHVASAHCPRHPSDLTTCRRSHITLLR